MLCLFSIKFILWTGRKLVGNIFLGDNYMQNKYAILSYQGLSGLYALGLSLWTGTIYLYMQQVGYSLWSDQFIFSPFLVSDLCS